MPGGVCAATIGNQPFDGPSRVAQLSVAVGPVTRTLFLGGAAAAFFPDRTDEQIRTLAPDDRFTVRWDDAVFYGEDEWLGPLLIGLHPSPGEADLSFVRSLTPGEGGDPASFFPAVNRNVFKFEIHSQRFGATYRSDKPVVNEAVIDAIPPYGHIYKLVEPVEFTLAGEAALLARAAAPKVVVQTCDVKLVVRGGIDGEVTLQEEDEERALFSVFLKRTIAAENLQASWIVWPRPEIPMTGWAGTTRVTEAGQQFDLELPRDLFFRPRWLAVTWTEPFEVNAAAALRFPALA